MGNSFASDDSSISGDNIKSGLIPICSNKSDLLGEPEARIKCLLVFLELS